MIKVYIWTEGFPGHASMALELPPLDRTRGGF